MYLKKLSIQGFKSFADPVSVEFDKGITCIVGPNGSGKSNISDALRWVLGEQSPKTLRGGRMDDVIFAGTDKRKSRGMAEVSLVIDNSDGSLPIDFTEVSVTRRMYRSGESEYLINGSKCRLRDIRELIMDTGIGVDGYSIIGQGRISDIINGRSEIRREILEETAGIVKYRTGKEEAEKKLADASANLARVSDIIGELEQRVGPLKKQASKASEYLELSEKYRENEINVILGKIDMSEKKAGLIEREISDLKKRTGELEEILNDTGERIRENKKHTEELEKRDTDTRESIMSFSSGIDELRSNVKICTGRINSLKDSTRIHNDEMIRLNDKLVHEQSELRRLSSLSEQLEAKSEKLTGELSDISAEYDRVSGQLDEKTELFNSESSMMFEISMKASSKAAELDSMLRVRKTLSDSLADVMKEKAAAESEQLYRAETESADRRLNQMRHRLDAEKLRLESCRNDLRDIIEKKKRASDGYIKAEKSLVEARAGRDMLERLEDSYEGYSSAVKLIMSEAGMKGIYGTAGSLFSIPRGYETAVDAALGGRVQNVICRDSESAGEAVRMLKARRAGRVTFLPLESLYVPQRMREPGVYEEEGFVCNAADCVECEPQYRKAAEYLLGGVIIVKTLEDAVGLARHYRSFRYVTLEGEYISPAGTITGGTGKKSSAGILERKNRLHDMERLVNQLENDKKSAAAAVKNAEESENALKKAVNESEERLRSMEIDIINAENEAVILRSRAEEHARSREKAEREEDRIRRELERTGAALSKLESEKSSCESSAEGLKKSAGRLASQRDALQKKIEEMSAKITSLKIDLETVRNETAAAEDLIGGCRRRIEEYREEYESNEKACRESAAAQELLEAEILQNNDEIKIKENEYARMNDMLGILKQEKIKTESDTEKLREEMSRTESSIFELRSLCRDRNSEAETAAAEKEALKNRLWDEFGVSFAGAEDIKKKIFDMSEGIKESRRLKIALRELGDVNVSAVEEYSRLSERYAFMLSQKKDLDEAAAALEKIISDADVKIRTSFRSSFDAVNKNFGDVFSELFGGGRAELRLSSPDDPFESDIDIVVQPPGKKLQNMNLLSGGEKTMTAIALMFAVMKTKPAPFCILDEVEAALDEANIQRFVRYLEGFEGIQFVLVTHQKVTMEHADVLYGVTMPEKGVSEILSIRLSDAAETGEPGKEKID